MILSCWECFFRELLLMTVTLLRIFKLLVMWGWASI